MKYLISILALIAIFGSTLFLTGCSVKSVVKPVVEKAYVVVVKAETIVQSAEIDDFITTLKVLDTPLKIAKTALDFISVKITDEKVKETIERAVVAITTINELVANITPEKVNEAKAQVFDGLATIKTALVFVGEYVGAELNEVNVASANADSIKDLIEAVNELEKALDKAM